MFHSSTHRHVLKVKRGYSPIAKSCTAPRHSSHLLWHLQVQSESRKRVVVQWIREVNIEFVVTGILFDLWFLETVVCIIILLEIVPRVVPENHYIEVLTGIVSNYSSGFHDSEASLTKISRFYMIFVVEYAGPSPLTRKLPPFFRLRTVANRKLSRRDATVRTPPTIAHVLEHLVSKTCGK